jgi:hypothetical protein
MVEPWSFLTTLFRRHPHFTFEKRIASIGQLTGISAIYRSNVEWIKAHAEFSLWTMSPLKLRTHQIVQ